MRVLFLTLVDFCSLEEKGVYTDLMRHFVENGHSVYIISPSEKRKHKSTKLIDYGNHKILKLRIGNFQKTNLIEKGISALSLERKFLKAIAKYFDKVKFDLVLYSTPPITLQKAVSYVKNRDNARTYLLLKDIFPQGAVDLGMINKTGIKKPLYRYFRKKEEQLYAKSDYIGCMSQTNVDYILNHNPQIKPDKVEICPNSIEPLIFEKKENEKTEIRKKYDIPLDKTIFIYGGNIGKPQGVNFICECLGAVRNNEGVYFVIAGSGTEYPKLESFISLNELSNVKLLPQIERADYENLVNACDVGLIFLDKRFTIPNFPSRLLSYMQASLPVLAATDKYTDIGKVIEEGCFGYWFESGDSAVFSQKVQQLCDSDLRKKMGMLARKYLEENYTVKHSYEIIMGRMAVVRGKYENNSF